MHVCMLTSSYPRSDEDGAGSFIRSLAKNVARDDCRVTVLAPHDGGSPCPPADTSVSVRYFQYSPVDRLRVLGYGRSLRADVQLRPEVYAGLGAYFSAALYATLACIWRDNAEILHCHWVVPSGFIGAVAARLTGRPLVISLHGSDAYLASKSKFAGLAAGFALRAARAITTCSQDLADRAIALGAPAQRTTVIPYGVDTDPFLGDPDSKQDLSRRLGHGDRELVVAAVGRLVRKKGFEYLLRAVPSILNAAPGRVRLVIGGDGDLWNELLSMATDLGIEGDVVFAGNLSRRQVASVLTGSDIVVLPSVRDEWGNVDGLPNVLLEAMAAGKPVVTTPVGGIPSVVQSGHNGVLVPERSSDAIAAAVIELICTPADRNRLGQAARETVRCNYSWARIADEFARLYRSVCTSTAPH